MIQDNKTIARRYFIEIMNIANMDSLYELLAPDFIFTLATHPEPYHGPDGFKDLVNMLHSAFPNFYINIQDMVADGDTVVTRWKGGGTHTGGPLLTVQGEIQATGRSFEIDGMTWHKIIDGKIKESLANEDTVGLLAQLGVLPSMPSGTISAIDAAKLVSLYFDEIMNKGNTDIIEKVVEPNFEFIIPTQPEPFRGYEGFRGFVIYLRNGFPDIHFTVERQAISGNKVAAKWKISGTHRGEFLGAPPTNRYVEDNGIDIFTLSKGKILSVHVNENDFGLMTQMGMIPEKKPAQILP